MTIQPLRYTRYILEMIAFPFFLFLVFHFGAHGTGSFMKSFESTKTILENFPAIKMIFGIFFLGLFTWIWHRPNFKRWIPCSHEQCKEGTQYLHALATLAFCLHFFPEAVIRHELFNSPDVMISTAAYIGFFAHFIIDVVTGIMLSTYWKETYQKILSIIFIIGTWLTAFFLRTNIFDFFPHQLEGIVLILGAFLLAMFVHLPHKPVVKCGGCKG